MVRSISSRPHGKRAYLSFSATCARGKPRLNRSRLLARSGCFTRFPTKNLPPKSRLWAVEAPHPERRTNKYGKQGYTPSSGLGQLPNDAIICGQGISQIGFGLPHVKPTEARYAQGEAPALPVGVHGEARSPLGRGFLQSLSKPDLYD